VSGTLLLAVSPGEIWAARVEDRLVELRIARAGGAPRVGAFFLGRIVAKQPELKAALVDVGEARPAFLDGDAGLAEGAAVLVQVTKEARADKATNVSLSLRLSGTLVDLVPGGATVSARGLDAAERARLGAIVAALAEAGEGFRIRAEALGAQKVDLAADIAALRARWHAIRAAERAARAPAALDPGAGPLAELLDVLTAPPPDRIVIDDRAAFAAAKAWLAHRKPALVEALALHGGSEPLFEHEGIAGDVAAALAPRVALAGGGALTIETMAAATLIDVDSGGTVMMTTNIAAAREVARQIRLRNIAGAIVIDFIGMREKAQRGQIAAEVARALRGDPAEPQILGWTRLGHLELQRKRRHPALDDILFERAPDGGRVKTALTVALEGLGAYARATRAEPARRFTLCVAPEVAAALGSGAAAEARRGLEARLGHAVAVEGAARLGRDAFDIAPL
jgi:Rne/Rng family ribonuclease